MRARLPLLVATLGVAGVGFMVVTRADAQASATCAGLRATIVGTSGDDVLVGTNGPDVISAGKGNDVVIGLNGKDVLCGGKGDDVIAGGGAADMIWGGPGVDEGFGEGGRDTCTDIESRSSCAKSEVTAEPPASDPPETTVPPVTTAPPKDTVPPVGDPPETTAPPAEEPPATTAPPETTTPPETTAPPATTAPPETTAPPATNPPPAPPSGEAFVETFDDAVAWRDRIEVEVHHRTDYDSQGSEGRLKTDAWGGDHGLDCGAPTSERALTGYSADGTVDRGLGDNPGSVVYWCRGHVMTSLGDVNGWSEISLSPFQTFETVSRVCVDVNVTNLGGRQWLHFVVTPAYEFGGMRARADGSRTLAHTSPTNSGPDRTGAEVLPETVTVSFGSNAHRITGHSNISEQGFIMPGSDTEAVGSKAIRRTHCFSDRGDGTIEVRVDQGDTLPDRVLTFPGSFPNNARVIFSDVTYTPDKDGAQLGNTWHWDNLIVEP